MRAQGVEIRIAAHPGLAPGADGHRPLEAVHRSLVLAEQGALPTGRELEAIAERWTPWRAYAAVCLWLSDR